MPNVVYAFVANEMDKLISKEKSFYQFRGEFSAHICCHSLLMNTKSSSSNQQ